jgi:hypothetical protein
MDCLCSNSIKLNILSFINKNKSYFYEEDLINQFYEQLKEEIVKKKDYENLEENFIKGYIKSIIKELVYQDKLIQEKYFEKDDNNTYYYMEINNELIKNAFTEKKKTKNETNEEKKNTENDKNSKINKDIKENEENKEINKERNELIKRINYLKIEIEKKNKENQRKKCKLLHQYNDLKDIAQEILGRIAVKKNITVKELYKEYDINENDNEEEEEEKSENEEN